MSDDLIDNRNQDEIALDYSNVIPNVSPLTDPNVFPWKNMMVKADFAVKVIDVAVTDKQQASLSPIKTLALMEPSARSSSGSRPKVKLRTYTARKKEITNLLEELSRLENYVELLKCNVSVASNDEMTSTKKKQLINACLRDKVHHQQFLLARVQSALSYYVTSQTSMIPFDSFIHLGKDRHQRIETLIGLKPRLLKQAKQYIAERMQSLDRSLSYTDTTTFCTSNNEYCATMFSCVPLDNVASVKQVFDALTRRAPSMARVVSGVFGDHTIRVEEELHHEGIIHMRLVRTLSNGFSVKNNQVLFSTYEHSNANGGECGMFVFGPIDQDDLDLFHLHECLRQDITSIFIIQNCERVFTNTNNQAPVLNEVSLIRYTFMKLHRTELNIPHVEMETIRDHLVQRDSILLQAVRDELTKQQPSFLLFSPIDTVEHVLDNTTLFLSTFDVPTLTNSCISQDRFQIPQTGDPI